MAGVDSWKALGLGDPVQDQDWYRARRDVEGTLGIGGGRAREDGGKQ